MNTVRERLRAPLQIETLQGLFGDDNESIREILATYLDDLTKNCEALERAVADRDRVRASRVAHSMKGASANVGANDLSALCADFEHRAKDGPWEDLQRELARVRAEAAEVLAGVRAELTHLA